jgi:lysyl-tRNA synthetase class 2
MRKKYRMIIIVSMNVNYLRLRSAIVKAIRAFFDERGYTEMHTPRLVGLPGQEPHLEPFETVVFHPTPHAPRPTPCVLITSPEYAMKRLLATGMDKIYDLGPCFRNEEPWDGTHDPEFLMIEWYRKNADLASLMDETEEMMRSVGSYVRKPVPSASEGSVGP